MQKIFFFELTTAIKDRPRAFQVITLVLFAFSLTMILIGTVVRLVETDNSRQVFQKDQVNHYAGFTSSASSGMPINMPIQK
jgi:hypothetical protein